MRRRPPGVVFLVVIAALSALGGEQAAAVVALVGAYLVDAHDRHLLAVADLTDAVGGLEQRLEHLGERAGDLVDAVEASR